MDQSLVDEIVGPIAQSCAVQLREKIRSSMRELERRVQAMKDYLEEPTNGSDLYQIWHKALQSQDLSKLGDLDELFDSYLAVLRSNFQTDEPLIAFTPEEYKSELQESVKETFTRYLEGLEYFQEVRDRDDCDTTWW